MGIAERVPRPTEHARRRMTSAERRDQIIDAARRVFIAHGPTGSRTKDIADEAGVNEALLYRHFSSKDELFAAAVVQPLHETVARLVEPASIPPLSDGSSLEEMVDRTRTFMRELLRVVRDLEPLLGIMLFGGEPGGGAYYRDSLTPVLQQMADAIRTNLRWWEHRDFDPDMVVRHMFGAVFFELMGARLSGTDLDLDALADEITELFLLGLARRP